MNFRLRPIVPADATEVAALIRTAFAAQPILTDPRPSALRVTEADVAAHLRTGGGAVAEADGAIVGSALWTEQDGGLYLSRLAVAPAWRSRGIAKALVAAGEAVAHDRKLPRIHLSTRIPLLDNRRLFAACGFVETTREAHPGYAEPTSVHMEKRLLDQQRSWRGKMGSRPWLILAAVALARIGFGYQYQTVASLGPELMHLFQFDYATLGTLIGAFMFFGAFLALPLGLLGRRFGDRLVLSAGLALMVVGPLISTFSDGPGGIGIGRGIAGIGAVAMIVLQNKIIADWFTGHQLMWALSVSSAAYPVGVGLAQLVLPPLTHAFGWQAGFLSDSVPMAVSLVLFLLSYRASPHAVAQPRTFSLPSARECLLLAIAGLIWTAYTAGYSSYLNYVPSLMAVRGEGLVLTGVVLTIATWGNVPATMLGAGLATRLGAFRIFLFSTCALVVGIGGAAVLDWPVTFAVVIGIVGSLHPGVIMAVGTLSARPENRAVGMGLFYSMYYAGGAVVPALCGRAADIYGSPEGALLAASVISVLALPMFLLHRRMAAHDTMLARA